MRWSSGPRMIRGVTMTIDAPSRPRGPPPSTAGGSPGSARRSPATPTSPRTSRRRRSRSPGGSRDRLVDPSGTSAWLDAIARNVCQPAPVTGGSHGSFSNDRSPIRRRRKSPPRTRWSTCSSATSWRPCWTGRSPCCRRDQRGPRRAVRRRARAPGDRRPVGDQRGRRVDAPAARPDPSAPPASRTSSPTTRQRGSGSGGTAPPGGVPGCAARSAGSPVSSTGATADAGSSSCGAPGAGRR